MPAALPTEFAPSERASYDMLQTQSAYFSNHPLLREILDVLPDVYLVLNENRQIVLANRALLDMIGCADPDEIIGLRPGEILSCMHARASDGGCGTTEFCRTCGAVRAILGSLHGQKSVQECRITQNDGTAMDLRVWTRPLILEGEKFSLFTVKDIHSEKRRQALEHIFFHDVLNTAGAIMGYADLLRDAPHDKVDQIKETFYELSLRLIDEIVAQRELINAEHGELAVQPERLNSLEFLRNIKGFYEQHEAARTRVLCIDPGAQCVDFISDRTLLGRVIGNMVKNALESCCAGQAITLSCWATSTHVTLAVHNPGVMPRDVQLQVFQRSFSTKGAGRGLGTYSMRLLSERYLKGSVAFTSSPEEGTVFKGTYPLALNASNR
jgi:signal transduction histidine kinase